MNNLLKKLIGTYFIVENQTQTHFSKNIFSMIFINFSKNFSKFFHRFLKNPLGSENFEKIFIIFKNRKKFFDKNENYQLDDAASEKSIKNRFSNIYDGQNLDIRVAFRSVAYGLARKGPSIQKKLF